MEAEKQERDAKLEDEDAVEYDSAKEIAILEQKMEEFKLAFSEDLSSLRVAPKMKFEDFLFGKHPLDNTWRLALMNQ